MARHLPREGDEGFDMEGRRQGWIIGSNPGYTAFNLFVWVSGATITFLVLAQLGVVQGGWVVIADLALALVLSILVTIVTWYRKTGRI